jgi:hypothetical protein
VILKFKVNEAMIAKATHLSMVGEKWSKNCLVKNIPWNEFLVSRKATYNPKGMHVTNLKNKWCDLILIVKWYITCEGHYGLVFYYHFHLLMVFIGYQLNFPYYFHKSLSKMEKFYQRGFGNPDRSLFHHGLIKILVECHLTQIGDSWENFTQRNNFSENPMQVNGSQELGSGFDLNSSFGICHNRVLSHSVT